MKSFREVLRRVQIVKLFTALYRFKLLQIMIPAAVIVFIYLEGQNEFRRINWVRTLHILHHIKPTTVFLLLGFALMSVAAISVYDFVLRRHFRIPTSLWDTFRYSWIANTSNSVIGFSGIAGAALRTFLYRKRQIPMQTITASIAFLSTITITGLSLLSWAGIFGILPIQILIRVHPWTLYAVWITALYLPGYVILQRTSFYTKWLNRNLPRMNAATIAASIGASLLEWVLAGISFWLIGSCLLPGLSLTEALGIYTISAITGLLSMAPGGIGGFDLTALLGLQLLGYPPDKTAAVLVLFRILYYFFPWMIGLVLAAYDFARDRDNEKERNYEGFESVLNSWQKVWHYPNQFGLLGELGAWSLGKLVFVSGFILLLSAATPGLLYRLEFTGELLSAPLMRLSHQLSVIIGLLLIVLSWGISHRVKRAYQLTLSLLCAGALFTFAKAFDFEEAIFLLIVALLLWISRNRFFRVGAPFSKGKAVLWGLVTFVAAYVYDLLASGLRPAYLKHWPSYAKVSWLINPAQHAAAAIAGLLVAWLLISLILILRPEHLSNKGASEAELHKLRLFLEHERGNLLTHMLFAGDKSFFWACNDQVVIPYAVIRNKLVVLGDPIGHEDLISEAIQECQRFADLYDLSVVFYQVSPHYFPIYLENGYRFFKLGEDALVPLKPFTLIGKQNASLRSVNNRFDREGFRFEVAQPPHESHLIERLREISRNWLKGKKEKGFSLGWFEESYLQLSTITLLISPEGEIIAFASLAPSYDHGETLSVDLMRHDFNTPNGTMDHLFVCLLKWAKEQDYLYFSLGMAPLSSVGQAQAAIREEKLAHFVFKHGGYWYGFEGLRKYKEKFSPAWEPRYLAYPTSVSLPILLLELVRLIARRPKKGID
ncbi:bifunctional lysylphosphatidylglycerol flippase/synthetase MprF [Paenibacillus sp. 19GGS1-52]|uniref:bifunctional lysylphosphatidylglycerol flippase/synthetase MprF n=1 Tax=Paenibacillus sp. 19GGS1-52 TaxID=2758563 RepID=UPI001EFB1459|nr:bifunctional lysylphosphatidylglycerol flippase/synthetase MprF [Paenibacillus sp. 19GGS1-52]ULO09897.1 bifunctional lysylphosphatidylglycerol flippase/synthetase MprF [Paenibacillus sp. 19GGS1-52]